MKANPFLTLRTDRNLLAAVFFALLIVTIPAMAASDESAEADHLAIIEFGATGEREISERSSHIGPAIGIEVSPIENWLEIEFGASRYRSRGATNWELELPFKKPFRVSSAVEIMPGLGPTWSHTTQPGERANSWGAEVVLDFFFWHSKRFGLYVEPSYGVALGNSNRKSAAVTGGFFVAVP